ncbi:hypothetical protein TREAZ_0716 [Leadbettera azotonutricia ZAS-9]|uniref:Uncharacterized protein n=1 Tax=Leadbettera azotonutricia (strain ATCC BAA-888 / DSM 13862 / ZAS-9) TaxID=545695 RepID=F5YAB5_LEAAZ|nr:hypothetical protein TREAZ_0716 [Leadbettera azotonutricia ZAS-9]
MERRGVSQPFLFPGTDDVLALGVCFNYNVEEVEIERMYSYA